MFKFATLLSFVYGTNESAYLVPLAEIKRGVATLITSAPKISLRALHLINLDHIGFVFLP